MESHELDDDSVDLTVWGKNVQSLQGELREQALFAELKLRTWDVLLLSETWRERSRSDGGQKMGTCFVPLAAPRVQKGPQLFCTIVG